MTTLPGPLSASNAGNTNLTLGHLTLNEVAPGTIRITPMEPERHPDPYPRLIDDLIARLRLHGTQHERDTISAWAHARYRQ